MSANKMEMSPIADKIIDRTFDAAKINAILNDPSVYPWICGRETGPLDASALLANHQHIALFGEHGGMIFHRHQPGLYEVHTQVLRPGRGPWAVSMAHACMHWMFTKADAIEIVTRIPHGNLAARALARRVNFDYEFTNQHGWTLERKEVPADILSLRIQRWMRLAPGLIEKGHWFHNRLEEEYQALGKTPELHPDDDNHDRYVGAAVEMLFGGQTQKAIIFYNRFAVMGGYQQIRIANISPLMIDIRDAILCVRDGNFWMI